MKKVVYLAPIFLLSFLGKNAMADQVEHVSKLDEALKEEAITKTNIAAQNTTVEQTQANPKISTNLLNTKRDNNSVADINTYTASKIDAQKVDNDQQNATSEQLQRAETSNVESSSVQRRVADQNNDIQRAKISNINATETVPHTVINNPANNKIHVHYTNTEGKAINVGDYDIDTSQNVANGQFKVPAGYTLSGDGKYSINVSTDTKYQIAGSVNTIDMNKVDSARDWSDIVSKTISLSDADSETVHNIALRYETSVLNAVKSGRIIINDKNAKDGAAFIEVDSDGDEYDGSELPTISDITTFGISANIPDSDSEGEQAHFHLKKGELHYYFNGTTPLGNNFVYTDNVSSTISDDDRDTLLGIWTKYTGGNYTDLENRIWSATYGVSLDSDLLVDGSGRVTKTNHVFNTDSVKSVSGNTVDVILQHQTQPVDVDSTSLGNNATNNVFEINGDNKKQVSAQIRNFKSTGLLDLITNATQIPNNWQATTNPNFDKVTLTNPIGYDVLTSKLLVLNL